MEHLDGLMNRDQLKNYPEKDLNKHIFAEYQLETIGHRIKYSLDKVRQEYPVNWIQLERYILQAQTFLSQNLTGSSSPFTSKVPSSIPSKLDSNAVLVWKEYSQRFAESRGFSPGTTVSSHREYWQGGIGNTGPQ